jgi:hypothetical protein
MKKNMRSIFKLSYKGFGSINSAKFSKCVSWLKEVLFLSHVISAKCIAIDPSKVQEVLDWKSPKSVMQIRCFLRLVGYYH